MCVCFRRRFRFLTLRDTRENGKRRSPSASGVFFFKYIPTFRDQSEKQQNTRRFLCTHTQYYYLRVLSLRVMYTRWVNNNLKTVSTQRDCRFAYTVYIRAKTSGRVPIQSTEAKRVKLLANRTLPVSLTPIRREREKEREDRVERR